MEEAGDSILAVITNASYCPANVSLAAIKQGEISSCFIDTVINPLLLLVAAAAGKSRVCLICLHAPLRSSSVEALQEVLHSHRDRKHSTQPAVCLSNSLSTADSCGHHCRLRVIRFIFSYSLMCATSLFLLSFWLQCLHHRCPGVQSGHYAGLLVRKLHPHIIGKVLLLYC